MSRKTPVCILEVCRLIGQEKAITLSSASFPYITQASVTGQIFIEDLLCAEYWVCTTIHPQGLGDSGLRWQVALAQEAPVSQRQPVCGLATVSQSPQRWKPRLTACLSS